MERMKSFLCAGLLCLLAETASGAPLLRLTVPSSLRQGNGEPMPVWVATGGNGPIDLFFEAWNQGDGVLNLTVGGGVSPWLKPELANTAPCTFDAGRQCRRIKVLFAASTLARGTYEDVVTVRADAALDSPQRVPIKIYVGSNVPDKIDLYVANSAGSTDVAGFQTPGGPSPTMTITPAGNLLTVSSSGLGSVRSLHSHLVQGSYQSGVPNGNVAGNLKVQGSSFAPDNRDVPIALHVTSLPIAQASPATLEFTTAASLELLHALDQQAVAVTNRGGGTLTISGVEVTMAPGESWLSAEDKGNGVYNIKATVGALAAGLYTGNVRFNSNAANNPVNVPVRFEVRPSEGPESGYRGLVNGASFSGTQPLAPGAIVSLFGVHLAPATETPTQLPLVTTAQTTKVLINGIQAPLYFVSFEQLNLQVPYEVAPGLATVQVMRGDKVGNQISAPVETRSPGIFRWGIQEYGIITNYTQQSNYTQQTCPLPRAIACPAPLVSTPARAGDVLVIWSTGLGPVTPSVATGAAAPLEPLSEVSPRPMVRLETSTFAIRRVPASFAGLTPKFVGLFQVNALLPGGLGNIPKLGIRIEFPDGSLSNVVDIAVEP